MRLGAEYMDAAKRRDILLQIANGVEKEARIIGVTSTIPSWVQRPFKEDQENFNRELEVYKNYAPIVQSVNQRLSQTAGPVWPDLTDREMEAIQNWAKSVNNIEAYVNQYFPITPRQYTGQVALLLIAVGAFMAPLFMGDEKIGLPFQVKFPFAKPSRVEREPGTRIPGRELISRRPLPVEAEVYRSRLPMRKPMSLPPVSAEARDAEAAYRTFARPLGPATPVAEGAPMVRTAPSSPQGRSFPRYRRP